MLLSLSHVLWSQLAVRQQKKSLLLQNISLVSPLQANFFLPMKMVRNRQRWDLRVDSGYN